MNQISLGWWRTNQEKKKIKIERRQGLAYVRDEGIEKTLGTIQK